MYTSNADIKKIGTLMHDIETGRISRNKNYFTLAGLKEYSRFKRAKLLISLINDLQKTSQIFGNKIEVNKLDKHVEIRLFNPTLKYNRTVKVTEAELELISSQSDIGSFN